MTCNGDSGGGFYYEDHALGSYIILGVLSQGITKRSCKPNDAAVFVDITKYIDWIKEKTHLNDFLQCEKTFDVVDSSGNYISSVCWIWQNVIPTEAAAKCKTYGMSLYTIENQNELQAFKSTVKNIFGLTHP